MKKLSTITIVLFALCLILSVFSCKADADLGDMGDTKNWNNQSVLSGTQYVNKLELKASKGDIDWFCFTDGNGVVFEDYTSTLAPDVTLIAKDSSATFTFNFDKSTELILWIHQPTVVGSGKADDQAGAFDFRGTVKINPNQGNSISDSGYREVVEKVGIVSVFVDETGGDTSDLTQGSWHGNYRVTEIWPLVKSESDSSKYELYKGLKITTTVEEGKTKKIILPLTETTYTIAIKQPDRFDTSYSANESAKATEQANYMWCKPDFQLNNKSDVVEVKSSALTKYFDTSDSMIRGVIATNAYELIDSLPGEK